MFYVLCTATLYFGLLFVNFLIPPLFGLFIVALQAIGHAVILVIQAIVLFILGAIIGRILAPVVAIASLFVFQQVKFLVNVLVSVIDFMAKAVFAVIYFTFLVGMAAGGFLVKVVMEVIPSVFIGLYHLFMNQVEEPIRVNVHVPPNPNNAWMGAAHLNINPGAFGGAMFAAPLPGIEGLRLDPRELQDIVTNAPMPLTEAEILRLRQIPAAVEPVDSYIELKNRLDGDCPISIDRPVNPIVLLKQYQVNGQWHSVPGATYIFDKDSLIQCFSNRRFHPLLNESIDNPSFYTIQSSGGGLGLQPQSCHTRYKCHYYNGSSQAGNVLISQLRQLLPSPQHDAEPLRAAVGF